MTEQADVREVLEPEVAPDGRQLTDDELARVSGGIGGNASLAGLEVEPVNFAPKSGLMGLQVEPVDFTPKPRL